MELPIAQLPTDPSAPVVLWFKNDLRVDDHPGLLAACQAGGVAPVFVFDPEVLSPLLHRPAGAEVLVAAVQRLRSDLEQRGSGLIVRQGAWDVELAGVARECGARAVVAEQEVEHSWSHAALRVQDALRSETGLDTFTWRADVWDEAGFRDNYREWCSARAAAQLPPLAAPAAVPALPSGLQLGKIPTANALRGMLLATAAATQGGMTVASAALATATGVAAAVKVAATAGGTVAVTGGTEVAAGGAVAAVRAAVSVTGRIAAAAGGTATAVGGTAVAMQTVAAAAGRRIMQGAGGTTVASASWDADGEEVANGVLAALASGEEGRRVLRIMQADQDLLTTLRAYLGTSGSTSPLARIMREEAAKLEVPSARGASFPALFSHALAVGAISRRRVHWEALQAAPPTPDASYAAAAAMAAVECSEFHMQLAARREARTEVPGADFRYWRWRGSLTDYCVAEPAHPLPGAPALVLVHGFGAFGDQWRGNLAALADAGYTVYAPTIPGFGRSEKTATSYTQDTWRDFLRDFILQVARGPVVLAGNSIGGFIAASCAADYPALVTGLVLINSAGPIDAAFDVQKCREAALQKKPPPRWFVEALSSALFWYLERSIAGSLKWLYPGDPTNADAWLAKEIYRAACDSGSIEVFRAVFYLPPPRALNYLVSTLYQGPTMVLQGALDPLNDAKTRARQMDELCSNVNVVLLQAGHCPHDERPDLVNAELLRFVERIAASGRAGGDMAAANATVSVGAAV